MALSNPYRPLEQRLKGRVGKPLPGVEAALLSLEETEKSLERVILDEDSKE